MMTFEESKLSLEQLAEVESGLREQALHRAGLEFGTAFDLNARDGDYLQPFAAEVDEETIAFRMDSKRRMVSGDGGIDRNRLYIHVPGSQLPGDHLQRMWAGFHLADGRKGTFEVTPEAAGIFRPISSISMREIPGADDTGEISVEKIMDAGLREKVTSIRGLRAIIKAMRETFEHVPFYS